VTRSTVLKDADWARTEDLLQSSDGRRGHPFRDHRQVVEGIISRYRTGIAWRDLPERFGPWQTVWKRHKRFSLDGTWEKIHAQLLADADATGELDWTVSIDSRGRCPTAHRGAPPPASPGCPSGRCRR
jgi:transposase